MDQPYGFPRWLRETFLWCAFLTFLVFALHGTVWAWAGVLLLIGWFFTGGVRRAYRLMKPEQRSLFERFILIMQLAGLALTQRNLGHLLDAERERRNLEYDTEKLDPGETVSIFSLEVQWGTLISVVCSILTVVVLEFLF